MTTEDAERRAVAVIAARIKQQARRPQPPLGHAYQVTIPQTTVSYRMGGVPEGEFLMGSPESESRRRQDEGPQRRVHIRPFSMQTHPVTWDEFQLFQFAVETAACCPGESSGEPADAVSRPTTPYLDMSSGMGTEGCPAIGMTQHAANKYAQWLSAKTAEFYRLPTEAEWEYACRAGTTTTYFFGDDASALGDYAWFAQNSGGRYHEVAAKKPNAWGLYDMLGNVLEWTLDQYRPYQAAVVGEPWVRPDTPYPLALRGGEWSESAAQVRCAARYASHPSWKQQDPQLPKSIWYVTDAPSVGFRLIRPEAVPSEEEMYLYWNNGVEYDDE